MTWNVFWNFIEEALQGDMHARPQPLPIKPTPMPTTLTKAEQLYALAKSLLGQHLSLNEAVPWGVGCAEAISKILVEFDVTGIPPKGIEGTAALQDFLSTSPQFTEIYTYTPGAIIISATGSGNGKIRGHVGVCGFNSIMSNSSETGKWDTVWDIKRWTDYYHIYGGIPIRYFLPM